MIIYNMHYTYNYVIIHIYIYIYVYVYVYVDDVMGETSKVEQTEGQLSRCKDLEWTW